MQPEAPGMQPRGLTSRKNELESAVVSHAEYEIVNRPNGVKLAAEPPLQNGAGLWDNQAMLRLVLTLATPAANLALDEALLDWAEATDPAAEF